MSYNKNRSPWKEFAFMIHQIQRAIEPEMTLNYAINHWSYISKDLANPPRKRKLQIEEFVGFWGIT
jgi:hypothetical protein